MTMPYLMNCEHSGDGWCLNCVKKLYEEKEKIIKLFKPFLNLSNRLTGQNIVPENEDFPFEHYTHQILVSEYAKPPHEVEIFLRRRNAKWKMPPL